MRSETQRVVAAVEGNELGLEHDVTVDLEVGVDGLDTSEAGGTGLVNWSKVDVLALDGSHVSTNINHHIWQSSRAGERNTSNLGIIGRTLNTTVVGADNLGVHQHKGGSGVSNGLSTWSSHHLSTDRHGTSGAELPETVGGVDCSPLHGTVELGGVNVTELVSTGCSWAEIGGEDRGLEVRGCVVEEGLLLLRLHGVELGEGESDKSVGLSVLCERLGNGGGELDGLVGD